MYLFHYVQLGCMACWGILWQLLCFSDCLLSCVGEARGARRPGGSGTMKTIPTHTTTVCYPCQYMLEKRGTHLTRSLSVIYVRTVAEKCSLLHTHALYQMYKLLYTIYVHYCAVDWGVGTCALLQNMFDIHNSKPCGTQDEELIYCIKPTSKRFTA